MENEQDKNRYYVNGEEVTKQEYVRAERSNGFHSKFGPTEPATASWSNSATGDRGYIRYGSSSR